MTQEEIEKIMLLVDAIWENAVRNKAYYQQAERVCLQISPDEMKAKEIAKMRTQLADLIRTNYQTKDYNEKIKSYIRHAKVYNFDLEKAIQEMAFWLIQSEKGRQELFQDENFIKYIQPRIPRSCRKYMKNAHNQEVAEQVRSITQPQTKQSSEDVSVD